MHSKWLIFPRWVKQSLSLNIQSIIKQRLSERSRLTNNFLTSTILPMLTMCELGSFTAASFSTCIGTPHGLNEVSKFTDSTISGALNGSCEPSRRSEKFAYILTTCTDTVFMLVKLSIPLIVHTQLRCRSLLQLTEVCIQP